MKRINKTKRAGHQPQHLRDKEPAFSSWPVRVENHDAIERFKRHTDIVRKAIDLGWQHKLKDLPNPFGHRSADFDDWADMIENAHDEKFRKVAI